MLQIVTFSFLHRVAIYLNMKSPIPALWLKRRTVILRSNSKTTLLGSCFRHTTSQDTQLVDMSKVGRSDLSLCIFSNMSGKCLVEKFCARPFFNLPEED